MTGRVSIIGVGQSGLAAARLLGERGASLFLSDHREISPQKKERLETLGVAWEEGGHTERILEGELIVLSPGVPPDLPLLVEAGRRGIPVLGELELAYRLCASKKILAVTGTNGKSTTVQLIGELLRARGHRVVTAGNIGRPWSGELKRIDRQTVVVLEVSSFQLETIAGFRPQIALFLNIAPDHLERHGTMEQYFHCKCRIFQNQTEKDLALVHPSLIPLLPSLKPRLLAFEGRDFPTYQDLFPHQRQNLAAALRAARLVDPEIDPSLINLRKALALPHRLEFVAERGGVSFYDDSKATNVAATLAAIASFPDSRLTLILGGRAKGESFSSLAEVVKRRDIEALLLGEAAGEIARELAGVGHRRVQFIDELREAVRMAQALGREVCLLAPACASFDRFTNYAERGEAFRRAVLALPPKPLS